MSYHYLAKYYDLLTENVEYEIYADYICRQFNRYSIFGIILDAGCGTGNMLSLLCARGYEMIGIDASEEMLAAAENKHTGALLLKQSLTKIDLYGTISGAISTLDVLNHFKDINEVGAFFEGISLFMEKGGIFIFDMNTAYKHSSVLGNNSYTIEFPDGMLVWNNAQNTKGVIIDLNIFIKTDNGTYKREKENIIEYTYDTCDIIEMLEKNFYVIEIADGENFGKPTETSERIIFTAKKK